VPKKAQCERCKEYKTEVKFLRSQLEKQSQAPQTYQLSREEMLRLQNADPAPPSFLQGLAEAHMAVVGADDLTSPLEGDNGS